MSKKGLKILSKLALFLVVFGFFQPMACDQKGFELAETLINYEEVNYFISAIGLYVIFFAAILSIAFTLILLITKKDICSSSATKIDIILLSSSIIGGVNTFIFIINEFDIDYIERGFYIVMVGWLSSLILLLCSNSMTKNTSLVIDKTSEKEEATNSFNETNDVN